jgi:lysozyme
MLTKELIDSVKFHEGYREVAYQDSVGVWTVGYGTNLQVLEVDEGVAEGWLMDELERCEKQVDAIEGVDSLSPNRRDVLIEMAYNLGIAGLRKFRGMWANIRAGTFEGAAAEMLDSKWARQVGSRAERLSVAMRNG